MSRYSHFIWGLLQPLGSWGVFAIAAIDGSLLGMPLDPMVAGYVYQNHHKFLLYVVMASAGSAVGSIVLYVIGYKGGEVLLQKRMSAQKFERMRRSFDRHEFWALMFPAMLPPPFPFKLFVLAAAAFEMDFLHFESAIFAGRFVRFLLLALLTIKFGPQVVSVTAELVHQHLAALLIAVAVAITGYVLIRRFRSRPA
ncbi:MAG TPA: VTT domain-containing protein [Terriglobales bacterium]|nr:VTT domain-containing protein [Terriglobales bacterium]